MPWLVWHRRPIRPNPIENVFDVENPFEKIARVVQANDSPIKSDGRTINASRTVWAQSLLEHVTILSRLRKMILERDRRFVDKMEDMRVHDLSNMLGSY